ncbi:GNAT family N-acetyltransferase [Streptomyces nogalater]
MTAVSKNNAKRVTAPVATERLVLRPFTSADVEDRYAYQRLPEVARHLYRPPLTREGCAESIAARAEGTDWRTDGDTLLLAVCRAGNPVSSARWSSRSPARTRGRRRSAGCSTPPRGRGYATEAAGALLSLAFGQLDAHRVFARLDVLNTASARVCERLGMRREAHLVENDLDGDRWGSEYVYAMLAREWKG